LRRWGLDWPRPAWRRSSPCTATSRCQFPRPSAPPSSGTGRPQSRGSGHGGSESCYSRSSRLVGAGPVPQASLRVNLLQGRVHRVRRRHLGGVAAPAQDRENHAGAWTGAGRLDSRVTQGDRRPLGQTLADADRVTQPRATSPRSRSTCAPAAPPASYAASCRNICGTRSQSSEPRAPADHPVRRDFPDDLLRADGPDPKLLEQAILEIGKRLRSTDPGDPYRVMAASEKVSVYVTTRWTDLQQAALRAREPKRKPITMTFPRTSWRRDPPERQSPSHSSPGRHLHGRGRHGASAPTYEVEGSASVP
jgi:hypothetical protein